MGYWRLELLSELHQLVGCCCCTLGSDCCCCGCSRSTAQIALQQQGEVARGSLKRH